MYKELTLVNSPTLSLVTSSEVKNYLKLSSDNTDDTLIEILIKTATTIIEKELGNIAICTQSWEQIQDGEEEIKLLYQPIVGTPTVTYYSDFADVTGTTLTANSDYRVISPNILIHSDGYFKDGLSKNSYKITFDCGLFNSSNYTNTTNQKVNVLKTAIFRTISWLYENREDNIKSVNEGNLITTFDFEELPQTIKRLIMPFHSGEGLI
jgi:hypothetical protein